ncbi:hypothetical protein SAY87_018244 [Trapa incisa]|uniref:C2H2-type domain-containing protein n=1 Tax=Trapa incisa TaxID=236973 RepID=A0AAN7LBT0_9MYRT|nr:hypothetical protein SAY87_018244 [Trapa incisa]
MRDYSFSTSRPLLVVSDRIRSELQVELEMSNLTSASNTEVSVSSSGNRTVESTRGGGGSTGIYPLEHQYSNFHQPPAQSSQPPPKKRRNLPGNPDPDSEVIALSPKTLMATNRFICEICNKGFQREQNLQLHRRGHNLPWKLKQRSNKEVIRKKVYVCPEPTCVHHDPSRALGDLTGIKKHFYRKHGEKKWKCEKCSKKYAVQSDWKAHSKICGTREYRCDCGTLFSRRDSFITHRAFCDALAEETVRSIVPGLNSNDTRQYLQQAMPQHSSSSSTNPNHHGNFLSNLALPPHFDPFTATLKKEQEITTATQQPQLVGFRSDQLAMMPPWVESGRDNLFVPQPGFEEETMIQNAGPELPHYLSPPAVGPSSGGMSATALLQKAAQIGHVYSDPGKTPQGSFGLALSSSRTDACGSWRPSLSLIQEMMSSGQMPPPGSFYDFPEAAVGGGGGRSEGMTRDFLGLQRPLSQSDIFDIASLRNCMDSSQDPQQNQPTIQKPWQG